MSEIINLKDVTKLYNDKVVLNSVSFRIESGSAICITGKSGTGKTTLGKIIGTILEPDRGEVLIFGKNLKKINYNDLFEIRTRIGMQFQNLALFNFLNVYENLAFPLRKSGEKNEEVIKRKVFDILNLLGLSGKQENFPDELSGGMQRRLAIGRVLIFNPEIGIFDEPFAGLDYFTSKSILNLIYNWHLELKNTIIILTSNPEFLIDFNFDQFTIK